MGILQREKLHLLHWRNLYSLTHHSKMTLLSQTRPNDTSVLCHYTVYVLFTTTVV
uniref:Uncharacterized protein n=1 Tax=Arundo donax TaxID=35708 RepID=A0A0A9G417_ARUDO